MNIGSFDPEEFGSVYDDKILPLLVFILDLTFVNANGTSCNSSKRVLEDQNEYYLHSLGQIDRIGFAFDAEDVEVVQLVGKQGAVTVLYLCYDFDCFFG